MISDLSSPMTQVLMSESPFPAGPSRAPARPVGALRAVAASGACLPVSGAVKTSFKCQPSVNFRAKVSSHRSTPCAVHPVSLLNLLQSGAIVLGRPPHPSRAASSIVLAMGDSRQSMIRRSPVLISACTARADGAVLAGAALLAGVDGIATDRFDPALDQAIVGKGKGFELDPHRLAFADKADIRCRCSGCPSPSSTGHQIQ